ncbi:non-specific lipid-transfer protein 2-like [Capsicum chacoense]
MKINSCSFVAIFLVLFLAELLVTESQQTTCNVMKLANPCGAFLLSLPPPPACCDAVRKQDPKCLCEYLKNPAYQPYVNRAKVEKALRDCDISMPNCM